MRYGIYCVKDSKTCWLTPHVDFNNNSAFRNFTQAVNTKDSQMNFSPKDFSLYRIGSFDNETGAILDTEVVCLARGEDCVEV